MKMCWVLWHVITQHVIHCCTFCDSCIGHKEIALSSFSSTSISGIRTRIKEAIFLSDVTFTLHLCKMEKRRCVEMNFNDEPLTMAVGFYISDAGQEFPSWCGPENKWERPPRCCSTRWARDAMIMYSPGVGSAFEKCWCWEKMALRCLKGEPRGGDRCSDIPAGV